MNPPRSLLWKRKGRLVGGSWLPDPNFGKALLILRRNPIIGSRRGEMIALPVVSIDTEIVKDAIYSNLKTQ
jgi:hypothetical protein